MTKTKPQPPAIVLVRDGATTFPKKPRPESWYNRHVRKRRERKAAIEAAKLQPMMGEGI